MQVEFESQLDEISRLHNIDIKKFRKMNKQLQQTLDEERAGKQAVVNTYESVEVLLRTKIIETEKLKQQMLSRELELKEMNKKQQKLAAENELHKQTVLASQNALEQHQTELEHVDEILAEAKARHTQHTILDNKLQQQAKDNAIRAITKLLDSNKKTAGFQG